MSGVNGDKARFHRDRKKNIAKRSRTKLLLKTLTEQPKAAGAESGSKPKPVSA
jgi:hypothetical protein